MNSNNIKIYIIYINKLILLLQKLNENKCIAGTNNNTACHTLNMYLSYLQSIVS